MKYSIELLDCMTELVFKIQTELIYEGCSFDEARATAKIILHKVKNKEIVVDSSLKSLLPNFLEQVRSSNFS